MGAMIDGRWHTENRALHDDGGAFRRPPSTVRHWITRPGSTTGARFRAEPGRYHLYLSEGCPWAHRVILARRLLGLEDVISASFVTRDNSMAHGWAFEEEGRYRDHLTGCRYLHEVYARSAPGYTGRATVPVLVDKVTGQMVNNESADIIRMMNEVFAPFAERNVDLYPKAHRAEIDALNARIYATVNNGVYRAGFAQSQAAHDEAVRELFDTLDVLEERLDSRRYLCGEVITEADWRLFTTLARFDAAYFPVFGCDTRRLADYPNLSAYTRDLYQQPGVAQTLLPPDVYRRGYGSIPFAWGVRHGFGEARDSDLSAPHDRARLSSDEPADPLLCGAATRFSAGMATVMATFCAIG
jgi:putative glutathione S-transferase